MSLKARVNMPISHRTEVEIGKSLSKENADQLEESLKKALSDKQVEGLREGVGEATSNFVY